MSQEQAGHHDVRMRGFTRRALVDDALSWVDSHAVTLAAESIAFDCAYGRVLASAVRAEIDVPSFNRSAMDGYALRATETEGAGDYNPIVLRVVGESLPGCPFLGDLPPGAAVRIMTGSPVPDDADAVLPAEYATEADGQVEVTTAVSPGKHVGCRGEDVAAGNRLLAAGRRLRPQDVGLLASVGVTGVEAVRRPRVRLLITGNELVPPGEPRGEFQIYESNSSVLNSLLIRDGAELESLRRIEDDLESIRQGLVDSGADVILVSGGSSVGSEDHAPSVLAEEGELAIHGIAMRPSSPAGMGRIADTLVFLLPGNPVSCLCAYDFFAGRAIRLLGGRNADWPYRRQEAEVARKIVSAVGRVDYCRVRLDDGKVEPIALSGASILSSTTRADGFVIIPAELEGYAPGTMVAVFLYDPPA
jgi:molybdopterin molybdotransferase